MVNNINAPYTTVVWFATSQFARAVGHYKTFDEAERRMFEYVGADARALSIDTPDGETIEFSPRTGLRIDRKTTLDSI